MVVHPSGVSRRRPPALGRRSGGGRCGGSRPGRGPGRRHPRPGRGRRRRPGDGRHRPGCPRPRARPPARRAGHPAVATGGARPVRPGGLYAPGGAHQALALAPSLAGRRGVDEVPTDVRGLARLTVRAQRHAPAGGGSAVSPTWWAPSGRRRPTAGPRSRSPTAFARPVLALAPVVLAAARRPPRRAHGGGAGGAGRGGGRGAGLVAPARPRVRPPGGVTPRPAAPELLAASVLRLPGAVGRRGAHGRRRVGARPDRPAAGRGVAVPPPPPLDGDLFDDPPWHLPVVRLGRPGRAPRHRGPVPAHAGADSTSTSARPAATSSRTRRCRRRASTTTTRDLYDGGGDEAGRGHVRRHAPGSYRRRDDSIARWTAAPRPASTSAPATATSAWRPASAGRGDGRRARPERPPSTRRRAGAGSTTAYRGAFPDLAGGLPRSYDVVTMHHYLEHTREPRRELAAAAKVLEPGGHLMIEVPDPASPWARRLGRCWSSWVQPQHLHFVAVRQPGGGARGRGFRGRVGRAGSRAPGRRPRARPGAGRRAPSSRARTCQARCPRRRAWRPATASAAPRCWPPPRRWRRSPPSRTSWATPCSAGRAATDRETPTGSWRGGCEAAAVVRCGPACGGWRSSTWRRRWCCGGVPGPCNRCRRSPDLHRRRQRRTRTVRRDP